MSENIEEQLSEQGFYVSTTVGWSMYPMLRNRKDRIVVLPVKDALKKYDLPLYRRPDGKYILHRILEVKDGYYIIRGDNTYVKEKVPFDWVLGYVSEFYRADRHVMTDSRGYRFYAGFWNFIYPLRWLWSRVRRFLSKIKHILFRKKNQTT